MTVILSREISSGLSPMSCVQTLQTCLAATCLLVWSPESGQDLTSRVRELMRILIFSQLTCGASLFFFRPVDHTQDPEIIQAFYKLVKSFTLPKLPNVTLRTVHRCVLFINIEKIFKCLMMCSIGVT